jgi:hypothetical protein
VVGETLAPPIASKLLQASHPAKTIRRFLIHGRDEAAGIAGRCKRLKSNERRFAARIYGCVWRSMLRYAAGENP